MNDATAQRKIFIGGLSYGTDDEKLRKYFSTYGPVQDAVVMKDPISRRSRGFGFITFCDLDSVDNALAHEPHTIDARKVEAKRAVPRSSDTSREVPSPPLPPPTATTSTSKTFSKHSTTTSSISTPVDAIPIDVSIQVSATSNNSPNSRSNSITSQNNISQAQIQVESRQAQDPRINMEEYAYNKVFVGGLHYDTRDAEFRTYFERFGRVITAEVMFNRETHKSRGFGFIVFEVERGAEAVVAEKEHVIDGKVVEVKRAIPRSKLAPVGSSVSSPSSPPGNSSGGVSPNRNTSVPIIPRPNASLPPTTVSPQVTLTNPNTSRQNDSRRTLSTGSAPANFTISRTTSGSTATVASRTVLAISTTAGVTASPKVASNANSRAATTLTSYAAALKKGGNEIAETDSLGSQLDGMNNYQQSDLLSQQQGLNQFNLQMFDESNRNDARRSLSEPIVRLHNNQMSFDYQNSHQFSEQNNSFGLSFDLASNSSSNDNLFMQRHNTFSSDNGQRHNSFSSDNGLRHNSFSSDNGQRHNSFSTDNGTRNPWQSVGNSSLSGVNMNSSHNRSGSIGSVGSVNSHDSNHNPSLGGLGWLSSSPQLNSNIEGSDLDMHNHESPNELFSLSPLSHVDAMVSNNNMQHQQQHRNVSEMQHHQHLQFQNQNNQLQNNYQHQHMQMSNGGLPFHQPQINHQQPPSQADWAAFVSNSGGVNSSQNIDQFGLGLDSQSHYFPQQSNHLQQQQQQQQQQQFQQRTHLFQTNQSQQSQYPPQSQQQAQYDNMNQGVFRDRSGSSLLNNIGNDSIDANSDDIFTFKDLRLDSPEFDPKGLGWMSNR